MADLQEVQTAVEITPENTLETIEAIWTSSRKIIIWRQTRQKIYGESGATLTFVAPAKYYQPAWFYPNLEWTWTVSDEVWELSYSQNWDWMRLPLQSSYSLTITPAKWHSSWYWPIITTTRVKIAGETVYSYDSSSSADYSETITVTAWKFSVLTIELDMQLPTTADTGWTAIVKVQKL